MVENRVAVFGMGYVGCVSAACLAHLGHHVIGVDTDDFKVSSVAAGRSPFFEPGLEDLVREAVRDGRLRATTSAEEGVAAADIALVCVGTPSESNGNINLGPLRRVCSDIGACLVKAPKPFIVAIRSTVFPGTCEGLVAEQLGKDSRCAKVVANPEFLREGVAIRDFMEPSLLVVGGEDPGAVARVAALYESLPVAPCQVSLRTAEMIKYTCYAFHALKISFANEIGALCDTLQVDGREVMQTVCKDEKLNTSAAYLSPGFAFGGSCLPKDLRALTYRASRLDMKVPLLESVLPSNEAHQLRAVRQTLDFPAQRIGIYGLAFKENSDDLRESPAIHLIETLIGKGRDVRIFDPHIRLEEIYGSNRNFVLSALPHIGKLLCRDQEELLGWAQCVVITQKVSADTLEAIERRKLAVLDLVGNSKLRRAEAL
jgi:GDP-mannose 6-dehydrogenase